MLMVRPRNRDRIADWMIVWLLISMTTAENPTKGMSMQPMTKELKPTNKMSAVDIEMIAMQAIVNRLWMPKRKDIHAPASVAPTPWQPNSQASPLAARPNSPDAKPGIRSVMGFAHSATMASRMN